VRFSFGKTTTKKHIVAVLIALEKILAKYASI